MTKWRMYIACWMPKVTDTHTHTLRICNTYCFSTATKVVRRSPIVTSYVPYIAYLVFKANYNLNRIRTATSQVKNLVSFYSY